MNSIDEMDRPDGAVAGGTDLSSLVVPLLKGVIYRDEASARDGGQWNGLLDLQAQVRDYVSVLGLDLVLDEAEGYAFLRSRDPEGDKAGASAPRLVTRRQLSFPVSLLLALLRKKLAEFDAGGGQDGEGVRLVLSREDIVELMRVFLPATANEARLMDRIDAHIAKVVDLGFLRKMKPVAGQGQTFEVRRILKAFVDAQWLAEFDQHLADYRAQLEAADNE